MAEDTVVRKIITRHRIDSINAAAERKAQLREVYRSFKIAQANLAREEEAIRMMEKSTGASYDDGTLWAVGSVGNLGSQQAIAYLLDYDLNVLGGEI